MSHSCETISIDEQKTGIHKYLNPVIDACNSQKRLTLNTHCTFEDLKIKYRQLEIRVRRTLKLEKLELKLEIWELSTLSEELELEPELDSTRRSGFKPIITRQLDVRLVFFLTWQKYGNLSANRLEMNKSFVLEEVGESQVQFHHVTLLKPAQIRYRGFARAHVPCKLIVQVVLLPLSSTTTLVAAAMFESWMPALPATQRSQPLFNAPGLAPTPESLCLFSSSDLFLFPFSIRWLAGTSSYAASNCLKHPRTLGQGPLICCKLLISLSLTHCYPWLILFHHSSKTFPESWDWSSKSKRTLALKNQLGSSKDPNWKKMWVLVIRYHQTLNKGRLKNYVI